jgi:hypothetical protein
MKKVSKILFLAFSVSLFAAASSNAQIEVSIRPVRPRTVVITNRPPAPSRRHIWVSEGWVVRGGRYVYRPGYWALPPRGRAQWIPGHWRDTPRRGSVWVEGHWS